MSLRSIDFRGMIDLDPKIIEEIECYLQEKENLYEKNIAKICLLHHKNNHIINFLKCTLNKRKKNMGKLHKMVVLTLLFALVTTSIYGQDCCEQDDECGSAYCQGSQIAHWSVYIPITILVVAAIWFGVSDKSHESSGYSNSQDALGSIDNSKRNSARRSCSCRSSSTSSSYGSYCHY